MVLLLGILGKDVLLEKYYLRKLSSENAAEKLAAARELGKLRSRNAMPRFHEFATLLIKKVKDQGLYDADALWQSLLEGGVLTYPEVFRVLG